MSNERKCWVGVNKNGFINMFTDEPKRNEQTGRWEGLLYLDSVIYNVVLNMVKIGKMTWENDAEYFEFNTGK